MNIQVLYATMTGHSRKLAQAIAAEIGSPVHDLKTDPAVPACDLLVLVSGLYSGESKPELLAFAKTLSPDQAKRVLLVTSSTKGAPQGSLRRTLEAAGVPVEKEEFHCTGSFLFMKMGHPNRDEISRAVTFVRNCIAM